MGKTAAPHRPLAANRTQQLPLIGLNSDVRGVGPQNREGAVLLWPYVQAVTAAGAVPLILPPLEERTALERALDVLDGLVLTGGRDLPPDWYGQKSRPQTRLADSRRLRGDRLLAELALERELPLLGICLGCQLLNVVMGGDLIQDIPSQVEGALQHDPSQLPPTAEGPAIQTWHSARIEGASRLAGLLGRDELEVNSSHHQAIGRLAPGLRAVAWAPDGIIEAAEAPGERFLLLLQWHPERIADRPDQRALFAALAAAASG
ncbi:MAG: gamma-glutamyl-gamma-aminobutyrate hydrolase family protein [Chloroflexia bacterium]|nr:gamma-glutamyl-gamma-aminobutyrate hydrolase family protein [Chloroflexia bacterium]